AVTAGDLRDLDELVAELPRRELTAAERDAVVHGRPLRAGNGKRETGNVALFAEGKLVAVAQVVGDLLKARVVVAEE
ncbi:MAG TPA: hypothetical protein VIW28_01805, partial [Gemmatimonadales bacterium]